MRSYRPALASVALLLAGCSPGPETPDDFFLGDEVVCDDPVAGWSRFEEVGAERGLTRELNGHWADPIFEGRAAVAANDMDLDGDIDLLVGQVGGPGLTYLNDGSGSFEQGPNLPSPSPEMRMDTVMVLDITGDPRPELLSLGDELMHWSRTDSGYSMPEALTEPGDGFESSFAVGDIDEDGNLDLLITTSQETCESETVPEILLLAGEDGFAPGPPLLGAGGPLSSQIGLFTDRDRDGDQDILIMDNSFGTNGQTSGFFRNDGELVLVDDAWEVTADEPMAGMGVDSADLNGDGLLDYCITDVGPTKCLMSVPSGYALAVPLSSSPPDGSNVPAVGWSIDLVDLDLDGWLDALQTGAPDDGSAGALGVQTWPDLAWAGGPEGFTEVTDALGFGSTDAHFGLATADFDGDGARDVVVVGPGVRPLLYMNSCSAGGWLAIELEGPPGNREGIGAFAEVHDSRGVQVRELYGPRAFGQSPTRFHFGLGDDQEVERVEVHWPGGHVSALNAIPVNREIVVTHPQAE